MLCTWPAAVAGDMAESAGTTFGDVSAAGELAIAAEVPATIVHAAATTVSPPMASSLHLLVIIIFHATLSDGVF